MTDQPVDGGEPYRVTRGKPPREHQFKPGQSGNPRGRPKGSKQIDTLFEEELDRKMTVTIDGRRKTLTKRQIMVRQTIDKALKGDPKALALCLMVQRGKAAKGDAPPAAKDFDALLSQDEQILMSYLERAPELKEGSDDQSS